MKLDCICPNNVVNGFFWCTTLSSLLHRENAENVSRVVNITHLKDFQVCREKIWNHCQLLTCSSGSSSSRCLEAYAMYLTCFQAAPETLEVVTEVIAGQLAIDVAQVQAESKFTDLGADSLDTVRGFLLVAKRLINQQAYVVSLLFRWNHASAI
jgi:hypothetical protein